MSRKSKPLNVVNAPVPVPMAQRLSNTFELVTRNLAEAVRAGNEAVDKFTTDVTKDENKIGRFVYALDWANRASVEVRYAMECARVISYIDKLKGEGKPAIAATSEALGYALDECRRQLLTCQHAPNSTGAYHNAGAMAQNEAISQFVRDFTWKLESLNKMAAAVDEEPLFG